MKGHLRLSLVVAVAAAVVFAGCSHKAATNATPDTNVTKNPDTGKTTNTDTDANKEKTPPPADNTNFIWQDVHFAYDDAGLSDEARNVLSSTGSYLTKNGVKVLIEGHCDERGSVDYNIALGERRAKSVQDYLESYGVSGSRLSTISYGKERPIATGHDEAAWAQNRRAHFVPQGDTK